MKNIFISLFIILGYALPAVANEPGTQDNDSFEKRVAIETSYMMKKLDLRGNTDAGDSFKKIYAEYRKDLEAVFHKPELIHRKRENGKAIPLTDEQIDKNNKTKFIHAENMVKVRKKYYDKFRKILSARDMQTFYKYERSMAEKARRELNRRSPKKIKVKSTNNAKKK